MHLLNRSSDKDADLNNVLTYVSKAFTSADNELKLAVYDGDAQCNPFLYTTTAASTASAPAHRL